MGIEFNLYYPIQKNEFMAIDVDLNSRSAFALLISILRKSIVICGDVIYYFDELNRVFKKFKPLDKNGSFKPHNNELLVEILQTIITTSIELTEADGFKLLDYQEEAEDSNGFIAAVMDFKLWQSIRNYWTGLTVQCSEFDTCHKRIHFANMYYDLEPTSDRSAEQPWCTDQVPFMARMRGMPHPNDPDSLVSIFHDANFDPNEECYNDVVNLFKQYVPDEHNLSWIMNYIYRALIGQTTQQVLNLVGPGGCGKSTFIELISMAFPPEFVTQLPQDCLMNTERCQRAFSTIASHGRLYICDEPSDPKDQDAVKLIANGRMSCKVLYQAGSREVKLNGRLICLSNRPVQWKTTDTGISRRYFTCDFLQNLVGSGGRLIAPNELTCKYGYGPVVTSILMIIVRFASNIDSSDPSLPLPPSIKTGDDILSVNGFMGKFTYVYKKTLKLDVMMEMAQDYFSPVFPFTMEMLMKQLKGVYSIKKNVVQDIGIRANYNVVDNVVVSAIDMEDV